MEDELAVNEDLIQSPSHKAAGIALLNFDGLLSTPLKLHEDLREGCGGQLWPAGMVLARYLLRMRKDGMHGKTIVELGAGGGLVGLAVALGCAITAPLYITDQANMLALMKHNIALNGLQQEVTPMVLDWGSIPHPATVTHPDIILAADCVYFEPAFPLLLESLSALAGPNTTVYFCFKKRRRADLRFMKAARKAFVVRQVEDDSDSEVYARENIFL